MKNFVTYIDDEITIEYEAYGSEDRNLGELFDWLGDEMNFIQANELYQFACSDSCGNIFEFNNQDEMILAREGKVTIKATGKTVEDFKQENKDFYNWFWNIK